MVLGAQVDWSLDDVRTAFKVLAKKFHPDVNNNPGAELQFQRITKAMDAIERERS